MRLLLAGLVLLALPQAAPGTDALKKPTTFDLVNDGKPACSIVIAEHAGPAARLAALELQFHVLKMSGAELPIRSASEAVAGRRILVGESRATRELGLRSGDFAPQEYLVRIGPETVILLGRDWEDTEANRKVEGRPMVGESLEALRHRIDFWKAVGMPERSIGETELPGLYDDQGTCLATYDFLERQGGVRWYGPSALSVVIPSRPSVTARGGEDVRRSPALRHRSGLPAGNWPFLKGQWGEFTQDQVEQYVMARIWDDPSLDVDGLIDEFFRLYFGPAGDPMKQFYLLLETTACDPANYPSPYHRRDGIDWKKAAWETLGTRERMDRFGGLMEEAGRRASNDTERQRVALWRTALWQWMREGYEADRKP